MTGYRWELGTQLANEVKAKDYEAATKSLLSVFDAIKSESGIVGNEEVKIRTLLILNVANRAAYEAGANPGKLFRASLNMVREAVGMKTVNEFSRLLKRAIKKIISFVPDKDYLDESIVGLAAEYIRNHCAGNVTREEVADVVGCSPSHLSRLFSQVAGHTFKEFVLWNRMERGKELLHDAQRTVTQVAFELGYPSSSHFTATFRKIVGITPTRFRRRMAKARR